MEISGRDFRSINLLKLKFLHIKMFDCSTKNYPGSEAERQKPVCLLLANLIVLKTEFTKNKWGHLTEALGSHLWRIGRDPTGRGQQTAVLSRARV